MPEQPGFRMSTLGQPPVGGIYDARASLDGAPSHWMVYWLVADTDASVARLVALGGTQYDEVQDTPFGRMTHVADPMGATFTLIQPQ